MNIKDSADNTMIDGETEFKTSRCVKQRSPEWFAERVKSKVTGSTLYAAIGLDGVARQKEHFDIRIGGLTEKAKPEHVVSAMMHGTNNEINAAATVVGKVLPMLSPGTRMFEEGFVTLESKKTQSFMIVSPDGSIRTTEDEASSTMAVELKCPVYDIQRIFPERYLLQCLSEIEALEVESLLYLCWRPDISSVFKVNRNTELFRKAFALAEDLYDTDKPKRPTKLSDEAKALKEEIKRVCDSSTTVNFIGIFPSLKHTENVENTYDNSRFLIPRFRLMLDQLTSTFDKYYELQRQPATQAVVFLCCDLDRKWGKDTSNSVPVCWFAKGSSLDTFSMRNIFESVMDECNKAGLHVPAASFDGQWHNICVRDVDDKPLTLLQLQKDVWKRVEKMSKREQLIEVSTMNKVVYVIRNTHIGDTTLSVVCTNGGIRLPKLSSSVAAQRQKVKNKSPNMTKNMDNDNSIHDTEPVLEYDVLEYTNDTDNTNEELVINMLEDPDPIEWDDDEITLHLNDAHMDSLLQQLKVDKQSNARNQWESKSSQDLGMYFNSGNSLRKLRDVELRIVIRYINRTFNHKMRESDRKESKISCLCKILQIDNGINHSCSIRSKTKIKQPISLSELALKRLSQSLKKVDLNIIIAELRWPGEVKTWNELHKGPYLPVTKHEQFYYPAFSATRKQLEVSYIDSSHLLTRMRRKSARGGLDLLSNEAWRKVAKSIKTSLSIGMVDCVLEPMTVSVANTHFSQAVETEMLSNGDTEEANLCRDIRQWWRAEDEAGLPARERIHLRSDLRTRLMGRINLSQFPLPGMHIHGWPAQLFEGILASIDAKQILYSLTPKQTYNVRAFSSMMGETFFSELTLYDRRGQGTVTSREFGRYIDTSIEKLHMRMDPKRSFSYKTSRKKVYNLVEQYAFTDTQFSGSGEENETPDDYLIDIRDHEFDNVGGLRLKTKDKEAKTEANRNAVSRGALGVRWETARRNESKLLPTYRLGLDLGDL